MKTAVSRLIKKLARTLSMANLPTEACESTELATMPPSFEQYNTANSFKVRAYDNYQQYVDHQRSKLDKLRDRIVDYDAELEEFIYNRFQGLSLAGTSVLSLAARLGGEVRGFKKCGALAIGIDLNPGGPSQDVLQGDFHSIAFPDSVFDIVFTNSIDHSLDPKKLISEASRVLKNDGKLILDVALKKPGSYEALDIENSLDALKSACENSSLAIKSEESVSYQTGFVSWEGVTLVFTKKVAR
jgi:SAM-dependent methyltransferase